MKKENKDWWANYKEFMCLIYFILALVVIVQSVISTEDISNKVILLFICLFSTLIIIPQKH